MTRHDSVSTFAWFRFEARRELGRATRFKRISWRGA